MYNKKSTALCRKSMSGKSGISVCLLALTQVRRVSAQRLIKMIAWRAKVSTTRIGAVADLPRTKEDKFQAPPSFRLAEDRKNICKSAQLCLPYVTYLY